MTSTPANSLTPGDVVRIVSRHAKKAFVVFCLVILFTVAWIVLVPKDYESVAKVYVRVGRENSMLDPSATMGQTVNIYQTLEAEINSMLEILDSRQTAELVIADVGIEAILADDLVDEGMDGEAPTPKRKSLVKRLKSWFSYAKSNVLPHRFAESAEDRAIRSLLEGSEFWAPKNSNVIHISCRAGHPRLAQMIAKSWTESFIEEHLRVTRTEGSFYFFDRQTGELERKLREAEENLRLAKSSSGLVSIEGQRMVLEKQSSEIRTSLLANQSQLEASQAKIAKLQAILDALPPRLESDQKTTELHEGWNELRAKLFELQIREQELKAKYSASNPDVVAVERQRQQVEQILESQSKSAGETVSRPNPTYQLMEQDLLNEQAIVASLTAEKRALEKLQQQSLEDFDKLNQDSILIEECERQRLLLEESYKASVGRTEQADIIRALQTEHISSISELQQASFNTRPAGLSRTRTMLIGLFLGVVLAGGFAGISEYFDRSFSRPTQAELALDIPVLVSIPQSRRQFVEIS